MNFFKLHIMLIAVATLSGINASESPLTAIREKICQEAEYIYANEKGAGCETSKEEAFKLACQDYLKQTEPQATFSPSEQLVAAFDESTPEYCSREEEFEQENDYNEKDIIRALCEKSKK